MAAFHPGLLSGGPGLFSPQKAHDDVRVPRIGPLGDNQQAAASVFIVLALDERGEVATAGFVYPLHRVVVHGWNLRFFWWAALPLG